MKHNKMAAKTGKVILGVFLVVVTLFSCEQKQKTPVPDFGSIQDTQSKKAKFFEFLGPIVKTENQKILASRERLLKVYNRSQPQGQVAWWDQAWLRDLAQAYGVELDEANPGQKAWQTLLRRVDLVPASLVLVQAAIESAWGTSRFAREGNNFFGEHCTSKGCGIVPEDRSPGQEWEVEVFASPDESVASYLRNINTHKAYLALRTLRAKMRKKGKAPDAMTLATAMQAYSERGRAYVEDIRAMIRANKEALVL